MNCTNCGAVMQEGTMFCTNCGTKIGNEPGDYKIVVTRPKKLFGVAFSFKIFIDGVEIGKLTYNGELVGNTKDLVSVYFIVKNLGLILAATLKGILIEIFSIETVFLINSLNQTKLIKFSQ